MSTSVKCNSVIHPQCGKVDMEKQVMMEMIQGFDKGVTFVALFPFICISENRRQIKSKLTELTSRLLQNS